MARPFSHILSVPHRRHEGKCKTLYRGYTMKVLRKHSIAFFMRRTLLFAAVCMLMAGTQSSAQGSSGERLGAGVAEILDEEADVPDLQNADTDATEKDGEKDILMAEALQTGAVGEAVITDRIPGGEKAVEEAADTDYDLVMANVSNTGARRGSEEGRLPLRGLRRNGAGKKEWLDEAEIRRPYRLGQGRIPTVRTESAGGG